ncbi:alpha-L-glutamate ligase [Haloglomus irregulare]|jgi:ribosomal protein S6--L-glutamate ligase|uniref:Alpha-L-glutamate ligase n=1 Tax=Haloglomus irregulare TaxID=2234134 RepID=A0A554NCZ9_9EURY|nr:alpha-L-glutamate ligase [Haloglomus irregulare]TSD15267.1 alpha-L-glutamate ligase [Haloglomus irregulare]
MLRLGVATEAETLARVREPLAERGIEAVHLPTAERTVDLTAPDAAFPDVDVGFVYPPRLAEGGVADALLDVPWVNGREAVLRSRHKGETLARLGRVGVPTPDSVVVSNPADEAALEDALDRVGLPAVVKPNSATRGIGVARVGDADSLLGVTDYLDLLHEFPATGDRSFLVQALVPDAHDFRVMCVEGEYVGAVERRLPEAARAAGRWKHNVHRGAEATGVDLPAPLRDLAERAARALEVPWLGVDLLVPGGDGAEDLAVERAVVNETNARPTVDAATKYESGFYDRLAALVRGAAER